MKNKYQMNFKEKSITQKARVHSEVQLAKKCPVCGKINSHHKSKEAKECQKRMAEPWFFSVEQDRMKKAMGL